MTRNWDRLRLRLGAVLVFLLGAPAAAGGGLAMAPLVGLAALIATPWRRPFARRASIAMWIGLVIAVWFGLSIVWSPVDDAAEHFFKSLLTSVAAIGFIWACRTDDRPARLIACVGVLGLVGLLAIEWLAGYPLTRMGREGRPDWILMRSLSKGVAILAIMLWGVALCAARWDWRRRFAIVSALTVATAVFALKFEMTAAALAAVIGWLTWVIAAVVPRAMLRGVGVTIAGLIVLAPALGSISVSAGLADHMPYSWRERPVIWSAAAAYSVESPLIGHGFDSSRAFPESTIVDGVRRAAIPLHPHNLGLQLWLEGGAVAALLVAALLIAFTWRVATTSNVSTAQAVAALLASWGVFAMLSFGAWQEWWIAAFGAAGALVSLGSAAPPKERGASQAEP